MKPENLDIATVEIMRIKLELNKVIGVIRSNNWSPKQCEVNHANVKVAEIFVTLTPLRFQDRKGALA